MMGLSKIPRTAGKLPDRKPISVSEALAQRNCSGTKEVGNCSMICRHRSPSNIQNITVKRARDPYTSEPTRYVFPQSPFSVDSSAKLT
jgi:hypothetical protein